MLWIKLHHFADFLGAGCQPLDDGIVRAAHSPPAAFSGDVQPKRVHLFADSPIEAVELFPWRCDLFRTCRGLGRGVAAHEAHACAPFPRAVDHRTGDGMPLRPAATANRLGRYDDTLRSKFGQPDCAAPRSRSCLGPWLVGLGIRLGLGARALGGVDRLTPRSVVPVASNSALAGGRARTGRPPSIPDWTGVQNHASRDRAARKDRRGTEKIRMR